MVKRCCVYRLTNTVTGKFYVGSTLNFHARMKYHHYSHARNPNKELAHDIMAYGWDAFLVEVLEDCTPENVRKRERYYIEALQAVEKGYNMTKATTYSDWMKMYNAEHWKDPEYRKVKSEQSSAVQKRRFADPAYRAQKRELLRRYTDSIKKPVGMFSKSGELLHTFGGVREAERWLLENSLVKSPNASQMISDCAKGGRHKTAYGFVWRFL